MRKYSRRRGVKANARISFAVLAGLLLFIASLYQAHAQPVSTLGEEPDTDPPTGRPTREPTRPDTEPPTKEPTREAPEAPEPPDTPRPTREPTREPTKEPEPPETPKPTREPTKSPTKEPTNPDTSPPTEAPAADPTRSPTKDPTPESTKETPSPTWYPTLAPSDPPITQVERDEPTYEPTRESDRSPEPTRRPTPRPTLRPTIRPTPRPTLRPSPLPTAVSTSASSIPLAFCGNGIVEPDADEECEPSIVGSCNIGQMCTPDCLCEDLPSSTTPQPTVAPSGSTISSAPSISPTMGNRVEPVTPPTTISPVATPTIETMPLQIYRVTGIQMTLDGVLLPFSAATEKAFEQIAADTISYTIENILGADQIQSLNVQVSYIRPDRRRILAKRICSPIEYDFGFKNGARRLQNTLVFNVLIEIRSVVQNHDANRYIGAAFNDDIEKLVFIESLKASGYLAFSQITSVSVTPGTVETGPETRVDESQDAGTNGKRKLIFAVVIPLLVVLATVVALAVFLVYIRRKERVQENPLGKAPEHFDVHDIASEIEISTGVDMSSLGDPVHPVARGAIFDGAESISSMSGMSSNVVSLDYEYQKAFGSEQNYSVSESQEADPLTLSKDDKTLEAEYLQESLESSSFEVHVPSGTVGLVLETSVDTNPVVYEIRDSSPIIGVEVGDRLLSVDGLDVTGMWASDVSRLIASKRNQPIRKFVFARPAH